MMSILSALLCLGLSLGPRTHVKAGTFNKPTLWAEPGPVIPSQSTLTLWCQGSLKAQEYRLYADGSPQYLDTKYSLESGDRAKFLITANYAERYTCNYLSHTVWSVHIDPLDLVVAGLLLKPSLSVLPSPVVPSGGNVTLQCGSSKRFGRFILTKEGDQRPFWTMNSQPQPSAGSQDLFPVGPVGPAAPSNRWMFRCYGCNRDKPQVCSYPSDVLELLVSGPSGGPSPPPTGPTSTAGAADTLSPSPNNSDPKINEWETLSVMGLGSEGAHPEDYTVGNLIQMGVAGLVLVVLGLLLFQALN